MNRSSALAPVACGAVVALVGPTSALADDRLYSDAELLAEGDAAYQQVDCPRAARFLFAYQQRNPAAIQASEVHRQAVRQALENCASHGSVAPAGTRGKFDTGGARGELPQVNLRIGGGPMANGRCDIYARLAVAQQEANLAQRCGYGDNRWHTGYRYHYDWCVGAASDSTRQETAARQALLERCRP